MPGLYKYTEADVIAEGCMCISVVGVVRCVSVSVSLLVSLPVIILLVVIFVLYSDDC